MGDGRRGLAWRLPVARWGCKGGRAGSAQIMITVLDLPRFRERLVADAVIERETAEGFIARAKKGGGDAVIEP